MKDWNQTLLEANSNYHEEHDIQTSGSVTTIYTGISSIGTANNSPHWQICKKVIDKTSNILISITWAQGTDDFINVWDNRASYSYS